MVKKDGKILTTCSLKLRNELIVVKGSVLSKQNDITPLKKVQAIRHCLHKNCVNNAGLKTLMGV